MRDVLRPRTSRRENSLEAPADAPPLRTGRGREVRVAGDEAAIVAVPLPSLPVVPSAHRRVDVDASPVTSSMRPPAMPVRDDVPVDRALRDRVDRRSETSSGMAISFGGDPGEPAARAARSRPCRTAPRSRRGRSSRPRTGSTRSCGQVAPELKVTFSSVNGPAACAKAALQSGARTAPTAIRTGRVADDRGPAAGRVRRRSGRRRARGRRRGRRGGAHGIPSDSEAPL